MENIITPEITNTQEAFDFGKIATEEQRQELEDLRTYYLEKANINVSDSTIPELEEALVYATQAQFMREALEGNPLH